jgi:hypothetical protein
MPKAAPSRHLGRIVIVSAALLAVSMGLRQCFGLFLEPAIAGLATSAATCNFAVALHNLLVNSTGMKLCGAGEWLLALPGQSEVRRRPKLPPAVWTSDRRDQVGEQSRHDGTA